MFSYETRPTHFLIPMVIVIVGGIFTRIVEWEYIGWAIWVIAAACVGFLIYSTVKENDLKLIQEEHYHYAEIMKLDAVHTKTKVVIDKTELNGGYMHHTVSELNIMPGKMKIFARGVLEGRKLTIREWTPIKKGKLFSDGEWRRLISFLKQPDWDNKEIKFAVQINPNNDQDGFELTADGQKWLETLVQEVLVPVSV